MYYFIPSKSNIKKCTKDKFQENIYFSFLELTCVDFFLVQNATK